MHDELCCVLHDFSDVFVHLMYILNHYVILGTFIRLLHFFYILSYGIFSLKYDS